MLEIRSDRQWRREVRRRDGDACRVCGETINLHAHHIKPRSKYPELTLELDNGITLCGNCHARLKGKEESTNLKTIIYNRQITDQLRRLNDKFCHYLEALFRLDDPERRVDAVFLLLNQLHIYPDSLNQFLPLIQGFIGRADGLNGNLAERIMLEFLKRNLSEPASQVGCQYDVYIRRGRDYLKNSNYVRAIANFDKAIALNPSHATAYCARAGAYFNIRDYARAITDCTKAIELDSNYATAYNTRGRAYYEQGDSTRASADFDTVKQLQLSNE